MQVFFSFVFWVLSYGSVRKFAFPYRSAEWSCRFVTLVHGVFCLFATSLSAVFYGPWPLTDPGGKSTPLEEFILCACLGYFLFDIGWCFLQPQRESLLMLVHHTISIVALTYVLATGFSATELIGTIFGAEASNPFLQIRWFLRDMGMKETKLFEVNNMVFVVVFFIFRIILGSYFLAVTWLHSRPSILIKLGGTGIYVVGWFFMYDIARYITKSLKSKKKPKQSKATESYHAEVETNGVDTHGKCATELVEKRNGLKTMTEKFIANENVLIH